MNAGFIVKRTVRQGNRGADAGLPFRTGSALRWRVAAAEGKNEGTRLTEGWGMCWFRISASIFLSLVLPLFLRAARQGQAPISIHPDNPKYFLFRGKPLVLITATEHYGSVI